MKTYTPEISTPAVAITLATAESNTQPILFTSQFGNTGTYESNGKTQSVDLKWVVKDLEVTLQRDWGTSQATITLTYDLRDEQSTPPLLPDVSIFRGGNLPYLSEEDEIRIYAGWVESSSTPITSDLLDETPFDFEDITTKQKVTQNPNKPLVPIFWGFIDKMEFDGSASGGENLTISCRDRTRIFADTRIVALRAFEGKTNKTVANSQGEQDLSSIANGDRVSILLELAKAAAGDPLGLGKSNCWKTIDEGLIVRGYTYDTNNEIVVNFPHDDPAQWIRTTTCRIMHNKAIPRMNAWAERGPIVKGQADSVLQVLNKTPMEIIDYLAKVEERPMDFFSSHINGDFILGPRVKDTSGFTDPLRSYRTYFYRIFPKECSPPTYNQMIMKIKTERSTLFSFNNFVLINATTKGSGVNLISSIKQGFSALPTHLANRTPAPPCKTQIIYDSGIDSYSDPEAGSLLVGLACARVWARDTQGIFITVIGDPTLYPSECIRVYNTLLHDHQTYTVMDVDKDNKLYQETKQTVKEVAAETIKEDPQTKAAGGSGAATKWIGSYINGLSRLPTDIKNLLIPYYSVRTVNHKITCTGSVGWTTTLGAITDI